MNKTVEKIPTWAFGYIFNGDMTGLTDEEVRLIDEALKRIGAELVCTPLDEEVQPYFTRYPLLDSPPMWSIALFCINRNISIYNSVYLY